MADLIALDRALAQLPDASETDYPVIAALVSAASGVVEKYCNRTFARAAYDELHTVVGPTLSIWVNNPPIVDVTAVRNGEMPALYVLLRDPQNQTQAGLVDVTGTAVVLTRTYAAVTTTSTFPFADYPTFTDLAAGINALGNGWTATLPNQFALWRTDDLTTNQTGRSARNISLPMLVFWYGLAGFRANKHLGEVIVPGGPIRGPQIYRVTYTGGYTDVPEPVQQACAELVQLTFATRRANPLMTSETLDKYSYTRASAASFDLLSVTSKMALNQHKVHRLTVAGVNAKA
jgi:hypothetical protein